MNEKYIYSLKEVLFTVDAVAPAEALVRQLSLAVAAFQALAVPVAIQHFEDEAVHDVLTAARAHRDFCRRQDGTTTNSSSVSLIVQETRGGILAATHMTTEPIVAVVSAQHTSNNYLNCATCSVMQARQLGNS